MGPNHPVPSEPSKQQLEAKIEQLQQRLQDEQQQRSALESSLHCCHQLLAAAQDPLAIVDHRGTLVTVNEAFAKVLECPAIHLQHQSLVSFLEPHKSRAAFLNLLHCAQCGQPHPQNLHIQTNSATHPWRITLAPFDDGSSAKFVLRAQPTPPQSIKTHPAQTHPNTQLINLSASMAQDFHTTLLEIIGNASLALMELPEGAPGQSELEAIEQVARRATQSCRQLMTYAGQSRFQFQLTELSSWFETSRHLFDTCVPHPVELQYELAPNLLPIQIDQNQMRKMVLHLLRNASDATTNPRDTIRIKTGATFCGQALLAQCHGFENQSAGTYAFVEITDSGCGMYRETLRNLFVPFYSTRSQHRGMGMAEVLGIVRGHGGVISVKSAAGKGTTIRIYLPRKTHWPLFQSGIETNRQTWATILIIDHDPATRLQIRSTLQQYPYRILAAPDAAEGKELLKRHAPMIDLVLLDLDLPHISSWDTLHELWNIQHDLPILLTGADAKHHPIPPALLTRKTAFLPKPYQRDTLLQQLSILLPKPRVSS